MRFFKGIAILTTAACVYLAYYHDKEMSKVRYELKIAQDALPAWTDEADRLMSKLIGCEKNRDIIDELRSEAVYKQLDLNDCKRDLDISMDYGKKCLKRHRLLIQKLKVCK